LTDWVDDMETDPTPPAGERAVELDAPGAPPRAAAPRHAPPDRPGMTARAALVGAALVGVWIVLVCYFVHNWNAAQQQFVIIMGFGAMLTLFGLKRVLGLLPAEWRLNRHELVVVYVMLLTAIPLTLIYRGFVESGIHQLQPEQEGRKSYPWVPRHFATRDAEAIESFNYGASDKTWRQVLGEVTGWALPAVYWGVTVLAFELSALGLILILRRKWIEEDRLQFPWATVPGQIVNERYSDETAGADLSVDAEETAARRRKTAGYLICLAICVPGLASAVMPSLASPIGVPPDVQGFGVDLTAYGIIPGSVEFRVVLEPFVLFMLLLLPLDVMISAVLTYVGLRMVLPNVLLFAGLPAYTDRIYRVLMYTMIRAGFMIGIPFWSIYFSRDYLLGVLRKAGIFGAREAAAGPDRLLAEFFRVQVLVAVYAVYHLVFDPAGLVDAQGWLVFVALGWAAWYFCLGKKTARRGEGRLPGAGGAGDDDPAVSDIRLHLRLRRHVGGRRRLGALQHVDVLRQHVGDEGALQGVHRGEPAALPAPGHRDRRGDHVPPARVHLVPALAGRVLPRRDDRRHVPLRRRPGLVHRPRGLRAEGHPLQVVRGEDLPAEGPARRDKRPHGTGDGDAHLPRDMGREGPGGLDIVDARPSMARIIGVAAVAAALGLAVGLVGTGALILLRGEGAAEEKGVNLNVELLNSRRNHPGYQCDHTDWGVKLCEAVGSPRVKLLYDIYHMQIMEGDLIDTITRQIAHIGHFHTAGNPGRGPLGDDQEIYYPAVMRAVAESGYDLYVGHEFRSEGDPVEALRAAFRVCDVSSALPSG